MRHFKNYKNEEVHSVGLIALDISIVMNPQRMYLNADSDEAIETEVNGLIAHFHTEFKSALGYRRDAKILGVLVFAKVLGYNRSANQHINCLGRNIFIHARRGTYNAMLAEDLYRRLRPRA